MYLYAYIYIYIYTYIYQTHIHVLKVKSTITRYVKCIVPGISTSKNLFKEIESVNSNAPGRALALNKCLLGEIKYIYKMKSSKGHCTIT